MDFQVSRVGSPALDLNYMLYCSLTGDVRRAELENMFSKYYATFASILAGGSLPMRFTLAQLKQDFYDKYKFGLIFAQICIPLIIMDASKTPDVVGLIGDKEGKVSEWHNTVKDMIENNPLLKPRMLAVYDDMLDAGLIPKLEPIF